MQSRQTFRITKPENIETAGLNQKRLSSKIKAVKFLAKLLK